MKHEQLTEKVLKVFYEVYNELGHGFLESIYEDAMIMALPDASLVVERQVPVPVWFRGKPIGTYYADILVEGLVICEPKCVRSIDPHHEAQLIHYRRATEIEVGLLLNFGVRPEVKRKVFDNPRKVSVPIRANPWPIISSDEG